MSSLSETRKRQANQEERLKGLIEFVEKHSQQSPILPQSGVKQTLTRKQSMRTASRRPSNVSRLILDESIDRRYSLSTTQELETFFDNDPASGNLGTPPQSSPAGSQPSSSGSCPRSPVTAKSLRAPALFSTPSNMNTPSTQYTPVSSFNSISSLQRAQTGTASPTLRRHKSVVMTLPSPNVTPTPPYHYPAHYAPNLATAIESPQIIPQDMNIRPHTSHAIPPSQQSAQPPATYQSAAAPFNTPPRLSNLSQYTTPQFQPPGVRSDHYVQEAIQLASPASFTPTSTNQFSLAQQIHHQQRRRRQASDVTEDMDLGS